MSTGRPVAGVTGTPPDTEPVVFDTASAPTGLLDALGRQVDYWATAARRTWRGGFATAFITPLLYIAAMGVMLGRYVDASSPGVGGAPSYLHFVAPGLLAGQAMLLAFGDATYPVYGKVTWDKTYVGMIATPLRVVDVALGHLSAIVVRVTLSCAIFMIALSLFGLFGSWLGAFGALLACALVAFAFAAVIFGLSAGLRNDSAFPVIYRVVQVPMYLFSGAFFPLDAMPAVVQWLATLNPLWHGVQLARMAMLGEPAWSAIAGHAAVLLLIGAVGTWWSVRRLTHRLIA